MAWPLKQSLVLDYYHKFLLSTALINRLYRWGVSGQLPQRAECEPQIVLFLTHVYDTKIYFKKLFDKRFRRIFSSVVLWCRQFFRNLLPVSPSDQTYARAHLFGWSYQGTQPSAPSRGIQTELAHPAVTYETGERSFQVQGARLWNYLPPSLGHIPS